MNDHIDDPIRGPLYRFSLEALREYRRDPRSLWRHRPRLYRRIPIRVFEPHDMLVLMGWIVGSIGVTAGFVACVIDMTR